MASIISNNTDSDIIAELQATLQKATVNGLPGFLASGASFKDVPILGSRAEADETQFVGTPIAAIVYLATDTHNIPDQCVGCVFRCEVMVAVKGDTAAERTKELSNKINTARNALNDDIPSDANGFGEGEGGDYHPRLEIGTPERDDEAEDPWAIAWMPVAIAYRTTARTTH